MHPLVIYELSRQRVAQQRREARVRTARPRKGWRRRG
jgi:hypothetical protein